MAGRNVGNKTYDMMVGEVYEENMTAIMRVLTNVRKKAPAHTDAEVEERATQYFVACYDTATLPDLASLALALGVSKYTLEGWSRGVNCSADRQEIIQKAYTTIEAAQLQATSRGSLNPILFIFLAKSKYGYREDGSVAGYGDRAVIEAGSSNAEIADRYNTPLDVTLPSLAQHEVPDMPTSPVKEPDIIDADDIDNADTEEADGTHD